MMCGQIFDPMIYINDKGVWLIPWCVIYINDKGVFVRDSFEIFTKFWSIGFRISRKLWMNIFLVQLFLHVAVYYIAGMLIIIGLGVAIGIIIGLLMLAVTLVYLRWVNGRRHHVVYIMSQQCEKVKLTERAKELKPSVTNHKNINWVTQIVSSSLTMNVCFKQRLQGNSNVINRRL